MPAELAKPLRSELDACRDDPSRFNETILCRASYWWRQEEICRSVVANRTTCGPSGNGVGKSYLGAGLALWFALMRPDCRVVIAAPTAGQLEAVLWSEIERTYALANARGRVLGGRFSGLTLEFGENWKIEGFGQGSVEAKSGRHAEHLLAIIDEASGAPGPVLEAIDSLNPSRKLYLGNPLRAEGKFWDLCENRAPRDPSINVIRVPSLESPDIHLPRSPRGMADAGWLEESRSQYGEESQWWLSHVLALFPGELSETLLAAAWIRLASETVYAPRGDKWLGVDLGAGGGGDASTLVARDGAGVFDCRSSRDWDLGETARNVRELCDLHGIPHHHVVYDRNGLGVDFDARLRAVGVVGAVPFLGGAKCEDPGYANMRTYAAWQLRRRLDPDSTRTHRPRAAPTHAGVDLRSHVQAIQAPRPLVVERWTPFAIPRHLIDRHGDELRGLRNTLDPVTGANVLEPKAEFKKRLKKSPDFLDALAMSFAYS